MSQPIIFAVDDDRTVARALARDLEKRFSPDYDIIVEPSPSTALERLRQLRDEGTEVALVIAGLWMEEQTGTQVLIHAHALHPEAWGVLGVLPPAFPVASCPPGRSSCSHPEFL